MVANVSPSFTACSSSEKLSTSGPAPAAGRAARPGVLATTAGVEGGAARGGSLPDPSAFGVGAFGVSATSGAPGTGSPGASGTSPTFSPSFATGTAGLSPEPPGDGTGIAG